MRRHSIRPEVVAIAEIQSDVDASHSDRSKAFDAFFEEVYRSTVLTTARLVAEVDVGEIPIDATQTLRISVPRRSRSSSRRTEVNQDPANGPGQSRASVDDEARVSIEERVSMNEVSREIHSVATQMPEFDFSDGRSTPPASTLRMSYDGNGMEFGDRFRGMSCLSLLDMPGFRPLGSFKMDEKIAEANASQTEHQDKVNVPDQDTQLDPGAEIQPEVDEAMDQEPTTACQETQQKTVGSLIDQAAEAVIPDLIVLDPVTAQDQIVRPSMDQAKEDDADGLAHVDVPQQPQQSLIPKPLPAENVQKPENPSTEIDQDPTDAMDVDIQPPEPLPNNEPVQIELVTVEQGIDTQEHSKKLEKQDGGKNEGDAVNVVKSFIGCVKQTAELKTTTTHTHRKDVRMSHEGDTATAVKQTAKPKTTTTLTQRKEEIPALKKAKAAKEMEEKKEAQRKKRKAQMAQWSKTVKKNQLPVKNPGKPDEPPNNKRQSHTEPSPNKKQKTDNPKRNKKNLNQATQAAQARHLMANITPDPTTLPKVAGEGKVPLTSPQYKLTPVGLLATDTRTSRKQRRRDKHVPSWAEDSALQNSLAAQRNIDAANIFPLISTLDPLQVFGTPDSTVVRNVAERTYQYKNRKSSSCNWSDDEEEEDDD